MFHLFKRANTAVPSASAGKVRLFVDTDGVPKIKNEAGALTALGGVGTQTNSGASSTALTLNFTQGLTSSNTSGVTTVKSSKAFQGFFDVTEYGAKGDNIQDDTSFINAAIAAAVAYNAGSAGAAGQRGSTVYFPAGVYKVTASLTSPNASGIVFKGESIGASTIAVAFASGDLITFASGKSFCGLNNLQIFATVTRTSGAFINTNGCNDIIIEDFSMNGAFTGIFVSAGSIKVTIQDYTINSCVAGTGVGILVQNGLAGDTYITGKGIFSNSAGARPLASIRIKQAGHFAISGANATSAITGLLIDPDAGQDVTYGFITDSLFDSVGTNGMLINPANSATARVRSLKFTNTWFAGAGNGAGALITSQGASAVIDDIEFVNSRWLNNSTHGLHLLFGNNVKVLGGTSAGNSVTTANTSDGIAIGAGVSKFSLIGVLSGVAGTATNTQRYGASIAAGASANFVVTDCDLSGNTTGALLNAATGINQVINNNLGLPLAPGATAPGTLLATAATAVYVTPSFPLPANSLRVGQSFRWTIDCTNAATASTNSILLKFGTAGTVADTTVSTLALGAGTAAAGSATIQVEVVVKAVGSGTTSLYVRTACFQNGAVGFTNANYQQSIVNLATLNSTVANFIGVAISPSAASTVTVQTTRTEVLSQ